MDPLQALSAPSWRASPLSSQWKPAGVAAPVPTEVSANPAAPVETQAQVDPAVAPGAVAAPRVSPLSSQWGKGLLSSAAGAAVQAGNVVSGKPATTGSAIQPTDGQTSPLAQKPVADHGGSAVGAQGDQAQKPYVNPSVSWTKGAPLPKTADGREFLTWGGGKNIGGKMYAIDPDAYATVRGQLDQQRQAMMANPEYAKFWRATDKDEKTPDWVLDDMAKNLVASGVTDISEVGKREVEAGVTEVVKGAGGKLYTRVVSGGEGGEELVPLTEDQQSKAVERDGKLVVPKMKTEIINTRTGEPVISQYGGRTSGERGIFGGTYKGSGNTGYGVQFTEDGKPVFFTQGASSSDIDKLGPLLTVLSFIPVTAPFAMAANAAIAASQGNWAGALLSGLGAVPGINAAAGLGMSANTLSNVNTARQGLGLINSVNNKDWLGVATSAGSLTNSMPGKLDIGGVNVNDLAAANQLYKGVKTKNPIAVAQAGWRLAS